MRGSSRMRIMANFGGKSSMTAGLLGLAAAIAAGPRVSSAEPAPPVPSPPGLTIAQGTCGGCHAVERREAGRPISRRRRSRRSSNRPGLTPETLSSLAPRDAHNYPEEMEFYPQGGRRCGCAGGLHAGALRDPDYRPAIWSYCRALSRRSCGRLEARQRLRKWAAMPSSVRGRTAESTPRWILPSPPPKK